MQLVVCYILHYTEDHMILLRGKVLGYKRDNILSSVTKRNVWVVPKEAIRHCEFAKVVCYSLLCRFYRHIYSTGHCVHAHVCLVLHGHDRTALSSCGYTSTCDEDRGNFLLFYLIKNSKPCHFVMILTACTYKITIPTGNEASK